MYEVAKILLSVLFVGFAIGTVLYLVGWLRMLTKKDGNLEKRKKLAAKVVMSGIMMGATMFFHLLVAVMQYT